MRPKVLLADITACLVFLTRIPLAVAGLDSGRELARRAWAFPVVGAAVGGIGAIVFAVARDFGLTPLVAALLAVAATIVVTGALHEDGLADVADGFGGGRDRVAKLRIMRDSNIGTYAALALMLIVLLRIACLVGLGGSAAVGAMLVASAAASRTMMVAVMGLLPPARADGLGADAGAPDAGVIAGSALISVVIAVALIPGSAVLGILIAVSLAGGAVAWLALRQIGGQTGDVLGAVQQISEAAALVAAVALS